MNESNGLETKNFLQSISVSEYWRFITFIAHYHSKIGFNYTALIPFVSSFVAQPGIASAQETA